MGLSLNIDDDDGDHASTPLPACHTHTNKRATGSSSAEYLRQLSMSQRSNGVFINDPKGLFILRWYREVKGDGTPQTARATRTERASTTS